MGKLYKYLSNRKHNIQALRQQRIFFAKPSMLNDPFDCGDIILHSYNNENISKGSFEDFGVFSMSEGERPDNLHLWAHYGDNFKGYAIEFKEDENNIIFPERRYSFLPAHKVMYCPNPLDLDKNPIEFKTFDGDIEIIFRDQGDIKGHEIKYDHLYRHLLLRKNKDVWECEKEKRILLGTNDRKILLKDSKNFKACKGGLLATVAPRYHKACVYRLK